MSVEELTVRVAEQEWRTTADYNGVSDHSMHVQVATVEDLRTKTQHKFLLGSFNVLANVHLWWQTGVRTDGKPLPSWYKLEDFQQLFARPVTNPEYQAKRTTAIVNMIKEFFELKKDIPAVLCLQECSKEIVERVQAAVQNIDVVTQIRDVDSLIVTISRDTGYFGGAMIGWDSVTVPFPLGEKKLFCVVNGHLAFNTSKNEKFFSLLHEIYKNPLLVIGDYNIPVMPISQQAVEEGCTHTLGKFINEIIVGRLGWKYDLAIHPDGWTNWNCRRNSAAPDSLAEHMDNMLFLHKGHHKITFDPVAAPNPGEWWKTE